ncbi:MAG: hypothetical protein AAF050_10335 [Cyanobacteria bacterium J06649_5]
MNVSRICLWALPLSLPFSLLFNLGAAAVASTIELNVLPFNGPAVTCPEKLTAYETARPRSPGGYATDGMIQLSAIATDISTTKLDDFSAIWTGTLNAEYANCKASAGMTTLDGDAYQGHSYLRVQLADGKATVILDMTGMKDANDFTATLLEQTLRDGNPRWAWGGTD